jgi:hypothetical protein
MANVARIITIIMQSIMNDMDVNSKYMDFLDDFEVIENYIESFGRSHPFHNAWTSLYGEICGARGDINNVRDKMQKFIDILHYTPSSCNAL